MALTCQNISLGSNVADDISRSLLEISQHEAVGEAIYTMCALLVVMLFWSVVGPRLRIAAGFMPTSDAATTSPQKRIVEHPVRRCPNTISGGVPVPIVHNEGSPSSVVPPLNSPEACVLVNAVRSGDAAKLPTLLDVADDRAASRHERELCGSRSSALAARRQLATQHLLCALRSCAARRFFMEGLLAYDHVQRRIDMDCAALWSLLLYCAVESGEFGRCIGFYQNLRALGCPGAQDFLNMVRYWVKQRDVRGLGWMLSDMDDLGFQMNINTRNRALSACVSGRALELAEMLVTGSLCGCSTDAVTWNILMKGYSQAANPARCFEIYAEMRQRDLSPTEQTFGILLDACIVAQEFDYANRVFEDIRSSGFQLNAVHLTTFMKGLVNAGHLEAAANVLEEMFTSPDTMPDVVAFSTLVKAHADRGNIGESMRLLEAMLRMGIAPDTVVFNIVLGACAVNPVEPAQVFRILDQLLHIGLKATTTTLSILIKALARTESWTDALRALENAPVKYNLVPEPRIYAQLAQACVKAGCRDQVAAIQAAMVRMCRRQGRPVDEMVCSRLRRLAETARQCSDGRS